MQIREFLWNLIPDFNTFYGFFFWSFLSYCFMLFWGWLVDPTVDEYVKNEIKMRKLKEKGMKMREQNKKE
jgi:hypothetical protein